MCSVEKAFRFDTLTLDPLLVVLVCTRVAQRTQSCTTSQAVVVQLVKRFGYEKRTQRRFAMTVIRICRTKTSPVASGRRREGGLSGDLHAWRGHATDR
jgi:hypothetical protein